MAITIKDVAKEAGVSIATVSRVINNKGYLSQNTKNKVFSAMDELNYKPNTAARTLQGKSTSTIGVILPSLDNPLYSELFENIEKRLNFLHYKTLLCTSNNQEEQEQKYFNLLQANQVEGIITSSHSDVINEHIDSNYPIVSFDRSISKNIPSIRSNNFEGGKLIAKTVIERKKNNVLILSGSKEDFYQVSDRIKGMISVFQEQAVKLSSSALDFESSLSLKKILTRKALESQQYDAICCTDDLTALIALTVSKEMNYYPLITGYDGTQFVQNFFPNLITACQPISEMAELMCDILIKKINNHDKIFSPEYVFPITISSTKKTD